jgi:hypothetical protein
VISGAFAPTPGKTAVVLNEVTVNKKKPIAAANPNFNIIVCLY